MINLTWTSSVNLCLSSEGLPLFAGYSKSRSRPSNLFFLISWMEDVTNSCLVLEVTSIVAIFSTPKFHPPIANNVFSDGFCCFSLLKCSYLKYQCSKVTLYINQNMIGNDMTWTTKEIWNSLQIALSYCIQVINIEYVRYNLITKCRPMY